MSNDTYTGSCLCGACKYEIHGPITTFYLCYCQRCRKATGSAHVSNIRVGTDKITWLSGENLLKRFKVPDSERFYTQFCTECGSSMPRYVEEIKSVVIPAGSLDHEIDARPEARIFMDYHAQWDCVGEDLPTFAEYPK